MINRSYKNITRVLKINQTGVNLFKSIFYLQTNAVKDAIKAHGCTDGWWAALHKIFPNYRNLLLSDGLIERNKI